MSYYYYKCLAINKNGLQLLMNMLQILGACFLSSQDPENAYEHLRISCDHCELVPNCIRKPICKHIHKGVRAALECLPT